MAESWGSRQVAGRRDRPTSRSRARTELRQSAWRGHVSCGGGTARIHARSPRPARAPALAACREIGDMARQAVCCARLGTVLPAGCHSQFYAEPLSSDERRPLTRSSKPPWAEINRFGRGPPCPGGRERRGAGLTRGNSLGECGARSFRHLGSFSASNKVTLEITPNFF